MSEIVVQTLGDLVDVVIRHDLEFTSSDHQRRCYWDSSTMEWVVTYKRPYGRQTQVLYRGVLLNRVLEWLIEEI